MRAGDVVQIDFGVPIGSEPGFARPAVVVTADAVLAAGARTFHVVPVTSNVERRLPFEVEVDSVGLTSTSVAQAHLCTVVSRERVVLDQLGNVGSMALAQIRLLLADLLDIA
ncbi:MAG: type II toxin-antitoxin system PemK/MazF family toxin [Microthrixaceae bacterium]|nr:type II toxin-antitoxin system PemK/MazF family toxin [Microthrixaceae bacterium]